MLYYVNLNGSQIIGYDNLQIARNKALELKKKYPTDKITVGYSTWYEGKKRVKGETNYHVITI